MLTKADEQKGLEDKCAEQMAEIKSLKALVSFLYVPKTIYSFVFNALVGMGNYNEFFLWDPCYST